MNTHGGHWRRLGLGLTVVLLGAAGCTTNAAAPQAPPTAPRTDSTSMASSPPPAGMTSPPASTTAPVGHLPADHSVCATVPAQEAAVIVGSAVTAISTPDTSDATRIHIDRCSYRFDTGTLGYQIDRFAGGLTPAAVVARTRSALGSEPGATVVDLGAGRSSIGFTVPAGARTMGRGFVQVNDTIGIDVSLTAPSKEAATRELRDLVARLTAATG